MKPAVSRPAAPGSAAPNAPSLLPPFFPLGRKRDAAAPVTAAEEAFTIQRDAAADAAPEGAVDPPFLADADAAHGSAVLEPYPEHEGSAAAADAPEPEAPAAELPWLDRIDGRAGESGEPESHRPEQSPELEAARDGEGTQETTGGGPEALPEWMSWAGDDTLDEELGYPDTAEEDDIAADLALQDGSDLTAEEVTPLLEQGAVAAQGPIRDAEAQAPEPERSAGVPSATGGSPEMRELADRLERFAASLRSQSPAELLAKTDPGDPLELLLAGYALGYSRQRQHGS